MSVTDTPAGDVTGTPTPPGKILAQARETRKLTVAEVAQQLKLSATQVAALEAGDYSLLPGPVFVRGFVRNYARLLELDAEPLLQSADLLPAPSPASAAVPLSRNIPFPERRSTNWLPYVLGLAVLVAAVAVFEFFISAPSTVIVAAVPPVSVEVLPVQPPLPAPQPQPAVAAEPQVVIPAAAPVETPATAAAAPVAQTAAAVPEAKPPGTAELRFAFTTPSWVEVRDRNERIIFSQLNAPGTEQQVHGRPPLSVVIGNARGVRLSYKGQPFDLVPHTRVEVARFILE